MKGRKNIRLLNYDYTASGAYFITLITRLRAPLFGHIDHHLFFPSPMGHTAKQAWLALPTRIAGLTLDSFVVMPNHLHGIIWLTGDNTVSLSTIIALYKAGMSRMWQQSLWQRNFYERVIRDERELFFARQYIEQNPLRWTLDRYY
ncbi:hypothetical protein [Pantoea endophytica]|uniref:hypothetical protein n=1 Tax=Pantoea endophytica TaxID=92488 RepID=UPI00301653A2